jgi:hypothetical protein
MSTATKLLCPRPADPIQLETRKTTMPRPGKGDVLVRVEATSVNPIDVKRAKGYGRRLLSLKGAGKFPLVLGNDFAGEIVSVGAGVSPWRPGDRVMVVPTGKKGGAHATHLTVDARLVRPAVGDLTSAALAAFPFTFTTLWLALRGAGISEGNANGQKVLLHGASGGLGQLALQIQLAHAPWTLLRYVHGDFIVYIDIRIIIEFNVTIKPSVASLTPWSTWHEAVELAQRSLRFWDTRLAPAVRASCGTPPSCRCAIGTQFVSAAPRTMRRASPHLKREST